MSLPADEPFDPALDEALGEAQSRIANLETALQTSRTIGIAIGIIMERAKLTPDDAFELLHAASSHTNRKLRDIAADVVYTGTIPELAD